jgi:hypothetical protein
MNRVDSPKPPEHISALHDGPSEELKHLAAAEAAVMLIECLMLTLVERGVLTTQQIIGTVEVALSTKRQMVADREHPEIATVAVGVLTRLANSLAASKP